MNRDKRQFTTPAVIDVYRGPVIQEDPFDPRLLAIGEDRTPGMVEYWTDLYKRMPASLSHAWLSTSSMTFAAFVEGKFVPEHVRLKTTVGQRHYQAILKHLMTPEQVNRIFDPGSTVTPRLRSAPGWPYLDEVRLCDLTSDHVRRLVAAASAAGYSSQTVKHIKNVLFAIIAHAQQEGCFDRPNPASLVKLGKITRRKQQNLTLHQAKAVLRSLEYPAREIALFAITTDMNLGEICDLRWKHVNLTATDRVVDGEAIPAFSIAIRTAQDKFDRRSSPTAGRHRNIEIREPLLSHLRELARQTPDCGDSNLVLCSEAGDPIVASRFQMTFWKQIGKPLGMPWLTWQILRRARASFMGELLAQLRLPGSSPRSSERATPHDPAEGSPDSHSGGAANSSRAYQRRALCIGRRFVGGGDAAFDREMRHYQQTASPVRG